MSPYRQSGTAAHQTVEPEGGWAAYGTCYESRRLHEQHGPFHTTVGTSFRCELCDVDAGCCKHGNPWVGKCEECADEVIAALTGVAK